jgi:NAD(P)-dependent dehydrogenase (short-subunit alcohol dehydrogenase family)
MTKPKIVVVTGSSGPLGIEITKNFLAKRGYFVIGVDINDGWPPSQNAENFQFIKCDLQDSKLRSLLIKEIRAFGDVDILINNAAITSEFLKTGYAVEFWRQTDEAFSKALAVNLVAPFSLSRDLFSNSGSTMGKNIVNIISTYGLVGPNLSIYEDTNMNNSAGYAASKGGLAQLTRYLATVLAPNVRVNGVAPGGILRSQPQRFIEKYKTLTPLARMNSEGEVVAAIDFISSDKASYITGQILAVDGGWTAW